MLTCANDVGVACCPAGLPYWCDGACSESPRCGDAVTCRYPEDPETGACTAGTYSATVDTISCALDPQSPGLYRVTASGTLRGCGSVPVVINAYRRDPGIQSSHDYEQAPLTTDLKCGTWSPISTFPTKLMSCTPDSTIAPVDAQWTLSVALVDGPPQEQAATVSAVLMVGTEPPHLVDRVTPCPAP